MTNEREERIRQRAHDIWEREGRPHGRHDDHWRRAKEEIETESGAGTPAEVGKPSARAKGAKASPAASPRPMATGEVTSEGTKPDGAPPSPAQLRRHSGGKAAQPSAGEAPGEPPQSSPTRGRKRKAASEGTKPDGAPPA